MEIEDSPILGTTVDKSQVPPIHQKRILAFVNHFITSTCSFLNEFILKCENKFIDLERKLQRVEASLVIIESKIASIPGIEKTQLSPNKEGPTEIQKADSTAEENADIAKQEEPSETTPIDYPRSPEINAGIKASEDARYRKYFKMLQFGVPSAAVKMKMTAENYDPNILDAPDAIIADGVPHQTPDE